MNGKSPRSKFGRLDHEVNHLAKILFLTMCFISLLMIAVDEFKGEWYLTYFKCVILLCAIIPISMRLNLDMAKIYYSRTINKDKLIEGAVVRNS
jgi:phospholipid-translocating ATPase